MKLVDFPSARARAPPFFGNMLALLQSFTSAYTNLRSNFLQTLLSMLGVIIGVAALVGMLSLVDGLEELARTQIAQQTSFENMSISAYTTRRVDGVRVPREQVAVLDKRVSDDLLAALPYPAKAQLTVAGNTLLHLDTARIGAAYLATTFPPLGEPGELLAGRLPDAALPADTSVATEVLINYPLALKLVAPDTNATAALGRDFELLDGEATVVGIGTRDDTQPQNSLLFAYEQLETLGPALASDATLVLAFDSVEDVIDATNFTKTWMADRFAGNDDPVEIRTYEGYLEGMQEGFLVFRIVMGFIIGIAVVVGGVGIMNVLVMSVVERTPEIGIRKAIGATRRTIMTQFLAESVSLAVVGSAIGTLLGIGLAMMVGPVVSAYAEDITFSAVFTWQTLVVVSIVAVAIGAIFGTYPALRAARLDPVSAIRRL